MGICFGKEEYIDQNGSMQKLPSTSDINKGTTTGVSAINFQEIEVEVGSRPLPTPPFKKDVLFVRAMYDFEAINDDDLPFSKGDRMEVDETTQNCDWWVARHVKTTRTGYIPSNYVCNDDNSPQAQDWWFDFDRKETDKMLLLPGNRSGTFLVRQSQANVDGLCTKLTLPCPKSRPVVQFRELEVTRDAVKLFNRLGAGCFGEVWKGKLRNVIDVAVKMLKPGTMSPDAFLEEAQIMHRLRHRRLVQLMAVCSHSEPILIITELMVNGSLLDYLRKDEGRIVSFPVIVDMATQVADAMMYLELENFVHRDLRAANILVGLHHDVKVADFGLARILQEECIYEATENSKFPIKWTSPEAALERKFSTKSDVWSFGVLLYELVTFGRTPYAGMSGSEVLSHVDKGYRMPKPAGGLSCSDAFYEMMLKCWAQVAEQRPTFAFVHSFLDDYFVNIEPNYQGPCD